MEQTCLRERIVSVLVVAVLLTSSFVAVVAFAPAASAAVTTGQTRDITNAASPYIRDDSTAIPFWGFGATANAGESLTRVEVWFEISWWSDLQTGDIKPLTNQGATSGVALFRDNGVADDRLDAGDSPINVQNCQWINDWPNTPWNYVRFTLVAGNELVPAVLTGAYQWFIVIRTDPQINQGYEIRTWINAGGIVFSNGANQPAFNIAGTTVTARETRFTDVSTGAIGAGIGQAALGLTIVDGGSYEYIDYITVRFQNDGGFDANDIAAPGVNPATSGVAMYRDDGAVADQWDASDTGLVPTAFAVAWPAVSLDINAEPIPNGPTGSYEYFIVVRTSGTIANGDSFTVYGDESCIRIDGTPNPSDQNVLTPEANNDDSASFRADLFAPTITSAYWSEASPYLYVDASGTLWFSDKMTTGQTATFNCQAQDDVAGSGMWYGDFSYEPSLASGGVTDNGLPYTCGYSIDSIDTELSTPATVTVYDRAANQASADLAYNRDVTVPTVVIAAPGQYETLSGIFTVIALAGDAQSGIDTTSAMVSWDYGASWTAMTWTGVLFKYSWDTGLLADGAYRLLVSVRDNVYNAGSDYVTVSLDNTGPTSYILSHRNGQYVNSAMPFVVVATASDASSIMFMEVRLDGGTWSTMAFDAANLYWKASVGAPGAGNHLIGVRATDSEGNVGPESAMLVIGDVNDPTVFFVSPAADADIGGWLTIMLRAIDPERLVGVKVYLSDGAITYTLDATLDPTTGYYEISLDTKGLHDGTWAMAAVVYDEAGRTAQTALRSLLVDNTEPMLAIGTPTAGTYIYGTYTVTATAADTGAGFDSGGVIMSVDGGTWTPLTLSGGMWVADLDTTALADGAHTILVAAIDDAGNVVVRSVTVYVDNTPPSVDVVAPFLDQRLAGAFTFATSARDDVGLRNVSARIAGPSWTVVVPLGFNAASGYYEWAADTSQWPDGEYGITPYATELSGRAYTQAEEIAFFVDNNAPGLDLMYPLDGEVITSEIYQLEVDALDGAFDVPGDQVSFRVDASDWRPMRLGNLQTWFFVWNSTEVADGPHTIAFRAVDASGKAVEREIRVVVDNHDPEVALVSPSAEEHVGGTYTFSALATDQVGVRGVGMTLVLGGQDRPATPAAYDPSTGLWELTVDTTTLPDGPASITLTATDGSGRASTTGLVAFSIDNHAPVLAIDRPAPDAVVIGGQFDIEVNASDEGFTLVTGDVEYDIDGAGWASVPWSVETPTVFTVSRGTALMTDSWHVLTVRATDAAGHVTERSVRFMVDNHDPALEVVSPTEDQYATGTLLFQVAASDPNGIATVTLDWRAGHPVAATLNTANSYYEFTLDTTTLADGNYTLLVAARDGAGRESQVALDFQVDNNIPSLTLAGPLTGEVLSGAVTVRGNVKDTFVDTLQFSVDGVGWVDMRNGEGTFDSALFADGPHTVTVRAVDGSGKAVLATSQVTFDNNPPLVSIAGFPEFGEHVAGEVPFRLFVSDAVAVASVTATVGLDAYPVYLNPASGFYEWALPSKRYTDGPRTVVFTATDPAGQNTTRPWEVYVDNAGPGIPVALPANGTSVKGKVRFSISPTDPSGVSSVQLRIGMGKWIDMSKQEDGTFAYTWETSLPDNDDSLSYTVRATDALGNSRDLSATIKVANPDPSWVAYVIMAVFVILGILLMFLYFRREKREGVVEPAGGEEKGSASKELEELEEIINPQPAPKKDEDVEVEVER